MGVDKFNHEGYFDPTTYEALTNIHREEMAADKKAAYLPLVYVCSPYAGDVETNVKNAKRYSRFAVDENAITRPSFSTKGLSMIIPEVTTT